MRFEVGRDIRVIDADISVLQYCTEKLRLDNPDYIKKERLGKWLGNTPKEISLYQRIGSDVRIPFGCLKSLWSTYPDKSLWKVKIRPVERRKYRSNIETYPYQEKAIKSAIFARNGVLVMPCGSGKTQCGLEIISRIGGRALWLTHTQDLLNQSMKRAKDTLEIDGTLGTITAGKVNIGTHITFATVQTMSRLDLEQYRDCFDIVVVDEAQHCCGSPTRVTQFYKVVSSLSARYKYGLTATPKRADGLERSMFALLGDIICEISREEVAHTTCPITVMQMNTAYQPDYEAVLMGDGTLNYAALVDNLVSDRDRMFFVDDVIQGCAKMGPTLVLANRVKYLSDLKEFGDEHFRCAHLSVSTSKRQREERKEALRKLNDGELDIIYATYQLAKEGLDVPNLRYVVFATPEQDETTVIQSAGRVGRKADGKEIGTVIDFVDDFGMYRRWAQKRRGYYKKIGAELK